MKECKECKFAEPEKNVKSKNEAEDNDKKRYLGETGTFIYSSGKFPSAVTMVGAWFAGPFTPSWLFAMPIILVTA